jgi:hypothetical protein
MRLSAPCKSRVSKTFHDLDARLSHPHLRRPAGRRHRKPGPPVGLDPPQARPRRPGLHRPARPLRPDPAGAAPRDPGLRRGRAPARRERDQDRRRGRGPRRQRREPQPADRRDRDPRHRRRGAVGSRRAAAAGVRRAGLSRGNPPQAPLSRPAPRDPAQEHRAAQQGDPVDPLADVRPGLQRVPDPDPDGLVAGRRARLPGALAPASGQVLRAAPGAPAVQAAADGLGLRPLFPDRPVLPRRGPARRPERWNSTSSTSR